MKFNEYLEKYNKTLESIANRIGTSKGYVHDLKIGRRVPSLAMIKSIQEVTKNKVKAADWISDKSPQETKEAGIKRRLACQSGQASADLSEVGP